MTDRISPVGDKTHVLALVPVHSWKLYAMNLNRFRAERRALINHENCVYFENKRILLVFYTADRNRHNNFKKPNTSWRYRLTTPTSFGSTPNSVQRLRTFPVLSVSEYFKVCRARNRCLFQSHNVPYADYAGDTSRNAPVDDFALLAIVFRYCVPVKCMRKQTRKEQRVVKKQQITRLYGDK